MDEKFTIRFDGYSPYSGCTIIECGANFIHYISADGKRRIFSGNYFATSE